MELIIAPFAALIIAQIIKVAIDSAKGKFSWKNFNAYGGLPSSHSALAAALAMKIGLTSGFDSAAFAISAAIGFLFLRDAVGFRAKLGNHGKILNQLIKDLPDYQEAKYPHLEERLGHTYLEMIAGVLIGILAALAI
jgi:hypothetical protein